MPVVWLAIPAIALIGLGFYMFHNTLQTNATQMAPEARGLAMSLFAFTLFVSQSIGVAVAAPVQTGGVLILALLGALAWRDWAPLRVVPAEPPASRRLEGPAT